jgi:2'-5' RNA ligase
VFFAIALEEAARSAAEALLAELRAAPHADAVRWVRPEGLHVTLRFLGEIAAEQLDPLVRAVAGELAGCAPFDLRLGAVHGFPTARRPRAIVCEVSPQALLSELAAAVERGAEHEGFAPDTRPFRAHLTLGRVRRGKAAKRADVAAPAHASMRVRQTILFQSELHRSGARYAPLEHVALGAALPSDLQKLTRPTRKQ